MANFLLSVVADAAKGAIAEDIVGSVAGGGNDTGEMDAMTKFFMRPEATPGSFGQGGSPESANTTGRGIGNDPNLTPQAPKPKGKSGLGGFLKGMF